jgi:hypothetical protein
MEALVGVLQDPPPSLGVLVADPVLEQAALEPKAAVGGPQRRQGAIADQRRDSRPRHAELLRELADGEVFRIGHAPRLRNRVRPNMRSIRWLG